MKFNEVMDKLFAGTPVYCGSNKYTVENHMLHRNGTPTFTFDYFDISSDKWAFENSDEPKSLSQIKADIDELSKEKYFTVYDFVNKVKDVIGKGNCPEFDYSTSLHSIYIETPDDMISLFKDCLGYNVNLKDKLVGFKIVSLPSVDHCVVVFMFYKKV